MKATVKCEVCGNALETFKGSGHVRFKAKGEMINGYICRKCMRTISIIGCVIFRKYKMTLVK